MEQMRDDLEATNESFPASEQYEQQKNSCKKAALLYRRAAIGADMVSKNPCASAPTGRHFC